MTFKMQFYLVIENKINEKFEFRREASYFAECSMDTEG